MIDSHCHLFFDKLSGDLPAVIDRARAAEVTKMITVGTDLDSSRQCLEIAAQYPEVYVAVGVHPHDAKTAPDGYLRQLEEWSREEKVVAIGEMGLDYHYNYSPPAVQQRVFREQIELAQSLKMPFIFHNREADADVLLVLQSVGYGCGVAHCYSSGIEVAQAMLELELYISFAGNLTFKNSTLPEVAAALPLEKLLVETDAPFMSPVPMRGKTNEPARTRLVALKLAAIQGREIVEVAAVTEKNTATLFDL